MTHSSPAHGCAAIVLAAGQGSRFGGQKLLAEFRGAPLIAHPLQTLERARDARLLTRIFLVLPAEDAELAALAASHRVQLVHQPDPGASQGRSLQLGLAAADGHPAAVVVLGDQPLLSLEMLRSVCQAAEQHPGAIVRPRFAEDPDTPGHPVLIPQAQWHLAAIPGGFREATPTVIVPLPGQNPDVDTPADLRRLGGWPE